MAIWATGTCMQVGGMKPLSHIRMALKIQAGCPEYPQILVLFL